MSPMNILMMSSSRPLQSWPRLDIIDDHTNHSLILCFVTDHWLEWSQYSNLLSLVPTLGNGMDWWLCVSPLGQMGQPCLHHHGIWTGSDQIHSGVGSSKYYGEKGATFHCRFSTVFCWASFQCNWGYCTLLHGWGNLLWECCWSIRFLLVGNQWR